MMSSGRLGFQALPAEGIALILPRDDALGIILADPANLPCMATSWLKLVTMNRESCIS